MNANQSGKNETTENFFSNIEQHFPLPINHVNQNLKPCYVSNESVNTQTCLIVQGRWVYMVAYGPLVNG